MGVFGGSSTTEPSIRMQKTYAELQTWKRQLIKADTTLKGYASSTAQLAAMMDTTLAAYPRTWEHSELSANDGHLPEHVKGLPAPGAAATNTSKKIVEDLNASLASGTYSRVEAWHLRYSKVKASMAPLELSRKHYEAACTDLLKAQTQKQKMQAKKGPQAAVGLDAGIAEKEATRKERWDAYFVLEEDTHRVAAQLAYDAQEAADMMASAMAALSRAMGKLAQQYASGREPSITQALGTAPSPPRSPAPQQPSPLGRGASPGPARPPGPAPALQAKGSPSGPPATLPAHLSPQAGAPPSAAASPGGNASSRGARFGGFASAGVPPDLQASPVTSPPPKANHRYSWSTGGSDADIDVAAASAASPAAPQDWYGGAGAGLPKGAGMPRTGSTPSSSENSFTGYQRPEKLPPKLSRHADGVAAPGHRHTASGTASRYGNQSNGPAEVWEAPVLPREE